jgi:hypothetical protein
MQGVVSSRALLESLWDAGADPVTLLAAAGKRLETTT